MPNQIDEEVKEDTYVMTLWNYSRKLCLTILKNTIGKDIHRLMIEGRISGENAYMGRTYMDVPGVDSNIFIITDEELMTGDFVKVKVTGIK